MNSPPQLLRVARTRECNTQQVVPNHATSTQHPTQQTSLKAAALLVLERNNTRNINPSATQKTTQQQRFHLLALASNAGEFATKYARAREATLSQLHADDVAACTGQTDATLLAYLHALDRGAVMDTGIAPTEYSQLVHCDGCGPVLLWTGCPPQVKACPWCFRRKAGKAIPRPLADEQRNSA